MGERLLDLTLPIAESGVRAGTVVQRTTEQLAPPSLRPLTAAEVRIVSGLHAGTAVRVGTGTVTNRDRTDRARPDPGQRDRGGRGRAAGSENRAADRAARHRDGRGRPRAPRERLRRRRLDGVPVTEEVDWPETAQLAVGGVLLGFGRPADRGAHLSLSDDGMSLEYNRPPRLLPPDEHTRYQLPAPPTEPPARALPILMALAPMGMAVMFVSDHRPLDLPAHRAAVADLMIITGLQGAARARRPTGSASRSTRTPRRDRGGRDREPQSERARWIASAPDPAWSYDTAVTPLPRLWERRRTDPDHLLVRVGTATRGPR